MGKTKNMPVKAPRKPTAPPHDNGLTILALDISSSKIGRNYNGNPMSTLTLDPKAPIGERCGAAYRMIASMLKDLSVDLLAIESPVGRYAGAVIPQARVSGAILAVADRYRIAYVEITCTDVKKVLTGSGKAGKPQMIAAAHDRTGRVLDEHQADAYGLWMAARRLKITSEEAP